MWNLFVTVEIQKLLQRFISGNHKSLMVAMDRHCHDALHFELRCGFLVFYPVTPEMSAATIHLFK